ncbi:winged helix-turn-helix domain-containing protein [Rhizobium sp. NFR07]|uniref:winged helix-turn-helix domain-containing protein n=1 Tax=Rhizobium sp. NFR07 TaxID=1566262 RepID=UPI0011608D39|nr:winged helix-turn-helix domain-containing protein [Rhizobium sp. NFR07]
MHNILLVESSDFFRSYFTNISSRQGFEFISVTAGDPLRRVMNEEPIDLFIVDVSHGSKEDGLETVKLISQTNEAPIIVVSADRLDEIDKVLGLELGASDYIAWPCGQSELLARIRVALRTRQTREGDLSGLEIYEFGGWKVDVKARHLFDSVGQLVKLTLSEFNVLLAFLQNPQKVLSREQLLRATRVNEGGIFDRSVDVLISRLRRKLEAGPWTSCPIRTERGLGYVLESNVTVDHRERPRPAVYPSDLSVSRPLKH